MKFFTLFLAEYVQMYLNYFECSIKTIACSEINVIKKY